MTTRDGPHGTFLPARLRLEHRTCWLRPLLAWPGREPWCAQPPPPRSDQESGPWRPSLSRAGRPRQSRARPSFYCPSLGPAGEAPSLSWGPSLKAGVFYPVPPTLQTSMAKPRGAGWGRRPVAWHPGGATAEAHRLPALLPPTPATVPKAGGAGRHLSLGPALRLPELQLSPQTEHAARGPGQLLGQPVVGLLHVLQLLSQQTIHLGEASAPGQQEQSTQPGGSLSRQTYSVTRAPQPPGPVTQLDCSAPKLPLNSNDHLQWVPRGSQPGARLWVPPSLAHLFSRPPIPPLPALPPQPRPAPDSRCRGEPQGQQEGQAWEHQLRVPRLEGRRHACSRTGRGSQACPLWVTRCGPL